MTISRTPVSERLAINGGRPLRNQPFAPWPYFTSDEVDAVARVVQSGKVNYWTGDEGRLFEAEFAAFTGSGHAVAVANGTVALETRVVCAGCRTW